MWRLLVLLLATAANASIALSVERYGNTGYCMITKTTCPPPMSTPDGRKIIDRRPCTKETSIDVCPDNVGGMDGDTGAGAMSSGDEDQGVGAMLSFGAFDRMMEGANRGAQFGVDWRGDVADRRYRGQGPFIRWGGGVGSATRNNIVDRFHPNRRPKLVYDRRDGPGVGFMDTDQAGGDTQQMLAEFVEAIIKASPEKREKSAKIVGEILELLLGDVDVGDLAKLIPDLTKGHVAPMLGSGQQEGDYCNSKGDCAFGLSCKYANPVLDTQKTCVMPDISKMKSEGESCGGSSGSCDFGLVCNSGTCETP